MPTIKLKAKKMSDATVSFISLVERGANRIPFKVVKQEKDMGKAFAGLDLGSLFTRKAETPKPQIVGVAVMKGDGYESVKAQVEAAGFVVSDVAEMEDGSVVFKQGDFDGEGAVIRVSEHVALITKGFTPYEMEAVSISKSDTPTSLTEVCKAQGFYPGVGTVLESLPSMVTEAILKADTPAAASAAMATLFSEAQAYTNAMLTGLPTNAFKLETVEPEVTEDADSAADGVVDAPATDDVPVEKGCKPAKDMAESSEGESATEDNMDEESAEPPKDKQKAKKQDDSLTTDEVTAIVTASVGDAVSSLTKKMEDMLGGVSQLNTVLAGFKDTVSDLASRVGSVEEVAKAAQDAVAGTVIGNTADGDHLPTRKADAGGQRGREIDTAFMPRVRKSH